MNIDSITWKFVGAIPYLFTLMIILGIFYGAYKLIKERKKKNETTN